MRLVYYKAAHGNVGDDLNPWLWPRLLGETFFDDDPDHGFIGIGSILTPGFTDGMRKRTVFGSGVRTRRSLPDLTQGEWDVRFVRGPSSARLMGGARHICDGAILAPLVAAPKADGAASERAVGFVRYFNTPRHLAQRLCEAHGLVDLDPELGPDAFIAGLRRCRSVIAEAMHGAILADAFRIPWRGVRFHAPWREGRTATFKWHDWMRSLSIPDDAVSRQPLASLLPGRLRQALKPQDIDDRAMGSVDALLREDRWSLSDDAIFRRAQEGIMGEVERLRSA